MPERNVRKVLVLRFSSLGDIVMATPLLRALRARFPQARIDMVVREDFLDLIRHNPYLDSKIGLPRRSGVKGLLQLRARLQKEGYDLIYDAHRSLRTRALMPLLSATHKAYFRKSYLRRDLALTFKLPLLRHAPRMLERYIQPLEPFGVRFDGRGPEIFLDAETIASAEKKVPPPPSGGGLLLGMIPSAQWPGKRWPLTHFRELMQRLVAETAHSLLVFGGPEDDFCVELCRDLPAARVVNAQGRLTILESAALLRHCALVVANDTGLMHLADALGVPAVLILGPTSEMMGCLPFHPQSQILEQDLWCRPCSKNGQAPCVRGRRLCLERTLPEEALGAVRKLTALIGEGVKA